MFSIGQKIVCIDDSYMKGSYDYSGLELGEIYTVTRISRAGIGVFISEVSGEFLSSRFREIDEKFSEYVINNIIEKIRKDELILIEQL